MLFCVCSMCPFICLYVGFVMYVACSLFYLLVLVLTDYHVNDVGNMLVHWNWFLFVCCEWSFIQFPVCSKMWVVLHDFEFGRWVVPELYSCCLAYDVWLCHVQYVCELFYMILNSGDELFLSYIHVVWLCHVQYVWWFINIVAVIFSCFMSWLVLHFWCMFVFVWCCAAMYDGAAHFHGFMSYFGYTGILLILDIVLISDLRGYSLFQVWQSPNGC